MGLEFTAWDAKSEFRARIGPGFRVDTDQFLLV